MKKLPFIAIVTSVIYLLLKFFDYHLDKYLSASQYFPIWALRIFIVITRPALIVLIIIYFKNEIGNFKILFAIAICLFSFICPVVHFNFSSEIFESKPVLIAKMDNAGLISFIKFRENKTYDINERQTYEPDYWCSGNYKERNDTFFLRPTYINGDDQNFLGDTLYKKGTQIITVGKIKDTARSFLLTPFNIVYSKTNK